jgi:hypothetical protein
MAQFHVIDTFTLDSRKLAILAGFIGDGTVRRGQFVRLPLEGKGYRWVSIKAIGFARRRDRDDVLFKSFEEWGASQMVGEDFD